MDDEEKIVTCFSGESRSGYMVQSAHQEHEKKRFEEICKKSAGNTKNPFITHRNYELATANRQQSKVKKAKTKANPLSKRKTFYFPARNELRPSKIALLDGTL